MLVRSLVVTAFVLVVAAVTSAACTRDYDALVDTGSSGTSGGKSSGGGSSGTSGSSGEVCKCSTCNGVDCDITCGGCKKCPCEQTVCKQGCKLLCLAGAVCDVLCTGGTCDVTCEEGASCACTGGGCKLGCAGMFRNCKSGVTCDAACP